MVLTKFAHDCFLIELNGARLLTDPGNYGDLPAVENLSAVIVTHTHQDHLDPDRLRSVLAQNSDAQYIGNTEVAAKFAEFGVKNIVLVGGGETCEVSGVAVAGLGSDHAVIYSTWPTPANTGYMIGDVLFHPGDSFVMPPKAPAVLLLPIYAPWMPIRDAIDYALTVKPKICIAAHDGNLKSTKFAQGVVASVLKEHGIEFVMPENGQPLTLA